jgi:hypothetical protein
MSNELKEFSRGDMVYKGRTLVQMTRGQVRFVSGAGIVKTLRGGVDGFFKGTKEGTASWTQGMLKAGMLENFVEAIDKQEPVTLTAVLSDNLHVKITGTLQTADWDMQESSFVNANFAINGRISFVKV